MYLPYISLTFQTKPENDMILPYFKGSTLRGGFGNAFKKVVCTLKQEECHNCILKEKCLYSYIFETILPSNTKIMRKYKAAPHPFIIEPPLSKVSVYKNKEKFSFNLTLIGKAINYLPYFIYTFEELGTIGLGRNRGKYILEKVKCGRKVIYDFKEKKIKSVEPKSLPILFPDGKEKESKDELTLNFLSPTRIISNETIANEISFELLIKQLLRRVALISYFHCGIDTGQWKFKEIIEKASKIQTVKSDLVWLGVKRYSSRQNRVLSLGGLTGKVTFKGNISQFVPLLKIGEVIHIGKGTSFGLGKFRMEEING